jgi:SHS2 domain-containing protein
MKKKYEIIEHTADVGIKAFGKNLSDSFENAAKAMFDLITDNSEINNIGQYNIILEAPDLEQLLVDWLSELLFLNSSKNLVFGIFNTKIDEKNCQLNANIFGEKFNTSKHKMGIEIKAVTYHMLEVNNKSPFFVKVLFDI